MPDISSISGSYTAIESDNRGRQTSYGPVSAKAKSAAEKLRKGEIILGTVLKVFGEHEAEVILPVGTFRAGLTGRLLPGDSLYFMVEQNDPGLVLRIHSVSFVSGGKELDIPSVLRILNLPHEDFWISLCSFMRARKPVLVRDEMISYKSAFDRIGLQGGKVSDMRSAFETLKFFFDNKLQPESELFNLLIPFLGGADIFADLLNDLLASLTANVKPETEALRQMLVKMKSGRLRLSELVKMTADKNLGDNGSLRSALIATSDKAGREISAKINKLRELLDSAETYNKIAEKLGSASVFFAPFGHDGKFKSAIIRTRSSSKPNTAKAVFFGIELPTDNLGKVHADGIINGKILNLTLSSDNPASAERLRAGIEILKKAFMLHGFETMSIKVDGRSGADKLAGPSKESEADKKISFVV